MPPDDESVMVHAPAPVETNSTQEVDLGCSKELGLAMLETQCDSPEPRWQKRLL